MSARLGLVLLGFSLCSCQHARPEISAPTSLLEGASERERLLAAIPTVEAYFNEQIAQTRFPSGIIGLVLNEELLWDRGFGTLAPQSRDPITRDSVFRIGSLTKLVTAVALLQLRDSDKLRLDDPASRYLPELSAVRYSSDDGPPVSLRHLLTHTSGIPRLGSLNYAQGDHQIGEAELLGALKGLQLEFSPGTRANYSNLGVALLGLVVSRVSGEPYRSYVRRHVLEPLRMTATQWTDKDVPVNRLALGHLYQNGEFRPYRGPPWQLGAAEAMGGLYSSLSDLAHFVSFELGAWPPRSEPDAGPLRRSSLRESQTVLGTMGPCGEGFGMGWIVKTDPELGPIAALTGATDDYSASVWMLPQRGIALISLVGAGGESVQKLDAMMQQGLRRVAKLERNRSMLPVAIESGLQRLQTVLAHPDPQTVGENFTIGFLRQVSTNKVVALLSRVQATQGACAAVRVTSSPSATEAKVRVGCDRGALDGRLWVEPQAPYLMSGLELHVIE